MDSQSKVLEALCHEGHHQSLLRCPNVHSMPSTAASAALIHVAANPNEPSAVFHFPEVLSSLLFDNHPSELHYNYARRQRRTLPLGCATTLTDPNFPSILPQSAPTLPTVFQQVYGPSYSTCLRKTLRLRCSYHFQPDIAYLRSVTTSQTITYPHISSFVSTDPDPVFAEGDRSPCPSHYLMRYARNYESPALKGGLKGGPLVTVRPPAFSLDFRLLTILPRLPDNLVWGLLVF